MDLRLVMITNDTEYDIANCEFAKSGKVDRKAVSDNAKLAVEGRYIVDHLLTASRLDEEQLRRYKL